MEPFTKLTTIAVPMPAPNIDTDQIMPTRFLRKKRSEGYHNWVFYDKRFQTDGAENPEFILNREPYRSAAKILVAGDNFGCGSSREGAVWGLTGFGFRVLIAPSFGDILFNNSLQNGLLPIVLPRDAVARLLQQLLDNPGAMITVDLQAQTVTGMDGASYTFAVDPLPQAVPADRQGRDRRDPRLYAADPGLGATQPESSALAAGSRAKLNIRGGFGADTGGKGCAPGSEAMFGRASGGAGSTRRAHHYKSMGWITVIGPH